MRDPIKIIAQNYHNLECTKPLNAIQLPPNDDVCVFYNASSTLERMAMSFIQMNKPAGRRFDNSKSQFSLHLSSINDYYYGPGHFIQRVSRALNLKFPKKPKGALELKEETIDSSRVLVATDGMIESDFAPLCEFIGTSDFNFLEVTSDNSAKLGIDNQYATSLTRKIQLLTSAEYLICGNNDWMHLAAALDIKTVTIVNNVPANLLYLPCMVDTHPVLSELYPQSCLIHSTSDNELVPKISKQSLSAAILGHVYPYWSDDYLKLIKE